MGMKILLASRNPGKLAEFQALAAPLDWKLVGPGDFPGAPIPAETGRTFAENAVLKALAASRHSGLPALADDSGLEVEALGGKPGIRSARFAGEDADDSANNRLLLRSLAGVPPEKRRARFVAVVALASPEGWIKTFAGMAGGTILAEPRGNGGFGYDPLFLSDELGLTFAEAGAEAKDRVSHRGRAFARLVEEIARVRPGPFLAARGPGNHNFAL
jgi:XTP/dITP diphosphohydrolase